MASSATQKLLSRHPLQRLSSPSRSTSAALHLLGLVSFLLSFKYLVDNPTMINASYGWHWQYLTIIGLSLATLTFATGVLADVTLSPALFHAKNTLALCSAPLEVVISILYWGISAVDKTLVVPPEIRIETAADVGFHAMPSLLLVLDLLFFSPPWTITAFPAMGLSSVLAVAYWAWVELCYSHNGFYPYPLFGKLDTAQRVVLFSSAALTMTGSTAMLQWLYGRVNGLQGEQRKAHPNNIKGE